jgi:hypothetical protein
VASWRNLAIGVLRLAIAIAAGLRHNIRDAADRSPSSDSHDRETDVTRLLQFEVRAKVARRRGGPADSLELHLAGSPTAT